MSGKTETRRPTKAEVVSAFRRETITEAVVRVMARKGFAEITMHDVAAEAGIGKATLYLYFRDCGELRRAAQHRVEETLLGEIEALLKTGRSLPEFVPRIVLRALELLDRRDDALVAALNFPAQWRVQFEERICSLATFESPATIAFIVDALRGVLERRLFNRVNSSREEVAASTTALLLHGILPTAAVETRQLPESDTLQLS